MSKEINHKQFTEDIKKIEKLISYLDTNSIEIFKS